MRSFLCVFVDKVIKRVNELVEEMEIQNSEYSKRQDGNSISG